MNVKWLLAETPTKQDIIDGYCFDGQWAAIKQAHALGIKYVLLEEDGVLKGYLRVPRIPWHDRIFASREEWEACRYRNRWHREYKWLK